jgi:hypothetical protein
VSYANSTQFGNLARLARVGKIFRFGKIIRIARLLKVIKERNNIGKVFGQMLKIQGSEERLLFFVLIFVILVHISSCMWVVVVRILNEETADNWIRVNGYENYDEIELYITSYYYTI